MISRKTSYPYGQQIIILINYRLGKNRVYRQFYARYLRNFLIMRNGHYVDWHEAFSVKIIYAVQINLKH